MDVKETTWKEMKEMVKNATSGSAPGPNGVPYIVSNFTYKIMATFPRNLEERNYAVLCRKKRTLKQSTVL